MAANLVLSECGLRPLPRIYTTPRSSFLSNKNKKPIFKLKPSPSLAFRPNSRDGFTRNWALNVSTPLRVESPVEEEEHETQRFDPSAPPPFNLADIRAAIPKHCWVKNPWKSMSYVVRDVAIVFALAAGAAYLNNWIVWPLYWLAQGTMFWALFVLGHDCGHGSFSSDPRLNSVVGHLLHSSILVPYHGWRISHRTHHQNHGHVENDESWHPMSEKIYKSLDRPTKFFRFTLPLVMLAYPFYLWARSPGKKGSHYHPDSDLFLPKERKDVLTSTACWTAMAALLVCLNFVMGPMQMLKLYAIPYWINVMWLDFVTYLHHHGHEDKLPWYRGKEWSYLRGGLTTLDRDYGLINNIHHDIGTHVIHHLFPQIPHYHLVEATEAAKPVLGKYYREPDKSGPLPLHLLEILGKSIRQDHYVSDEGDVVYYEADPSLYGEIKLRIESTVDPIARGLSCLVNVVVPDQNTSDVVQKYKHEYFSVRTIIGLFRNPLLGLSAVLGTSAFTIGADVAMDVSTMNFRRLDGCASFTSGDSTGSLMIRDWGDNVTASLYHTRANTAVGMEMSRSRAANINISVGVQHFFGETTLKGRVDSTGSLAGVVQYNWSPHTFFRVTAAIPHDQNPRFGFSFALGS